MQFLDVTLPEIADNLALDEALLLCAEKSSSNEILRLWEWPSLAVVLGSGCRLADDVNESACLLDEVRILRRTSGGGTVLLGHGCLIFSLILAYDRAPELRQIASSYRYILEAVRNSLRDIQPGIELAGISDLTLAGRKFSGNSQQRKRHFLLHHGTLLYDFPLDKIGRYLQQPSRQPEYRASRPHDQFVMNLPASIDDLKQRLRTAWQATDRCADWPESEVRRLITEKYARPEWTRRR